jgi:hypothetical protein
MGKSWQQHFETDDRETVERFLRSEQVDFEWKPNNTLWTSQLRPAAIDHPETGQTIWFNQADLWHYTNLGDKGDALRQYVGEQNLPTNAYYGDGSPIEADDLRHIRETRLAEAATFDWHQSDVLALDNFLVAHGRQPFTGERRVLVALA